MSKAAKLSDVGEQLALVFAGQGMQRMTARVLAALLFTEQPSVTMAELAEALQASAGSISGALKQLTAVGVAERVPAPASRRDLYRIRSDAWATLYTGQNQTIAEFWDAADAGIAATDNASPARQRLVEMRDFYAFLMSEIPPILQRWREQRGT